MLKKQYVRDLLDSTVTPDGTAIEAIGWIKSRRRHGRVAFLDVVDSTGAIQVVARIQSMSSDDYDAFVSTPVESAVRVMGIIATRGDQREIMAETFEVIARDTLNLQRNLALGSISSIRRWQDTSPPTKRCTCVNRTTWPS